jgi:hypothetical protein
LLVVEKKDSGHYILQVLEEIIKVRLLGVKKFAGQGFPLLLGGH